MAQLIQYLSTTSGNCGIKATAPVVGQAKATVAVAAGATLTDLLSALATGATPLASGQISNPGCADVRLILTYLTGADCDSCTVDSLTTADITVIVPGKSVFPLPEGLVTRIQYQTGTTNATGVFTASNVTIAQVLNWYSSYTPCCDAILVP